MKNSIVKIILVGLFLITPHISANACQRFEPRKVENIAGADVVVVAKVLDKKIIKNKRAVMNIKVNDVLKGTTPDELEIYIPAYWNGTLESNTQKLLPNKVYIFALKEKNRLKKKHDVSDKLKSKPLRVMHNPCTKPHFFLASNRQIEMAKKVLAGR